MVRQVVLITGGSSGIGQATASYFAQRGSRVYEMSRHESATPGVIHCQGDVTLPTDCQQVVAQVTAAEGRIDVLICNAGMGIAGAIEFTSADQMHRQMEVNFFGAVNVVQSVLPLMRRQQSGRILIVSSLAAYFGIPFQSFYSASKAALCSFAQALRSEVSPWGIQVGCLLPGDVHTGFTSARTKELQGSDVYPRLHQSIASMERDEQSGQSPQQLARRLYRMASCRHLSLYHYEGFLYHLFALLHKLLPASVENAIVRRMY